jgi:hypothetical protein
MSGFWTFTEERWLHGPWCDMSQRDDSFCETQALRDGAIFRHLFGRREMAVPLGSLQGCAKSWITTG